MRILKRPAPAAATAAAARCFPPPPPPASNAHMAHRYQRLVETGEENRKAKAEVGRLQSYLNRILREIEQKAPAVRQQRVEYERALVSHDELTSRLVAAMRERNEFAQRAEGATASGCVEVRRTCMT